MSMTDPIADLLNRIRTTYLAKHDRLDAPASKLKADICRVLAEQGLIDRYEMVEGESRFGQIRIFLKYTPEGEPLIRHIKRVSTPGRRVYRRAEDIKPVLNGLGVWIVSTSQGLLTDSEARERRVGGEILCEVW
ncbi:MAG: 30S ribosomal protein S8 [Acidobacteriota bacterium]